MNTIRSTITLTGRADALDALPAFLAGLPAGRARAAQERRLPRDRGRLAIEPLTLEDVEAPRDVARAGMTTELRSQEPHIPIDPVEEGPRK